MHWTHFEGLQHFCVKLTQYWVNLKLKIQITRAWEAKGVKGLKSKKKCKCIFTSRISFPNKSKYLLFTYLGDAGAGRSVREVPKGAGRHREGVCEESKEIKPISIFNLYKKNRLCGDFFVLINKHIHIYFYCFTYHLLHLWLKWGWKKYIIWPPSENASKDR